MYEALPAGGGQNTLHPPGRMCAITRTAGARRRKVIPPSTLPATRSLDKRGRHQVIPRRPRFPFTPLIFGQDSYVWVVGHLQCSADGQMYVLASHQCHAPATPTRAGKRPPRE